MYHWHHRGLYLILTDQEELQLVHELSGDNVRAGLRYHTDVKTRRDYERRINAYLKAQYLVDPDAFCSRFVFRCWHNDEAQRMFPEFLDAYARATRLATIGRWKEHDMADELTERLAHHGNKDLIYVSLLNRPRFWWFGLRVIGVLSFPRSQIVTVTGSVDNFALLGESFHIRFGSEAVRVLVHGSGTA